MSERDRIVEQAVRQAELDFAVDGVDFFDIAARRAVDATAKRCAEIVAENFISDADWEEDVGWQQAVPQVFAAAILRAFEVEP